MFCGRHTVVFANLPPYGVLAKCACVAEVTDAYPLLPLFFSCSSPNRKAHPNVLMWCNRVAIVLPMYCDFL